MKFCRNCGKQINETAAFCPYCGQKTTAAQMQAQPQVPPIPEPKIESLVQPQPVPIVSEQPKQEKKSSNVLLIILLAAVFAAGMCVETLMKVVVFRVNINLLGAPDREVLKMAFHQMAMNLANEAAPVYALPIFILRWMRIVPRTALGSLLRWIPYLILFFIPILAAMVRKKGIPLLISGAFTLLEGIIVLFAVMTGRYLNLMNALPFILEAVLVILLAIGFLAKNKALCLIAGILSAVFAVFSLLLTPAIFQANAAMMPAEAVFRALRMTFRRWQTIFRSGNGSYWPVYKAFVLLMYALLAFFSVGKLKSEKR